MWSPSIGFLAIAIGLLAGALAWWWTSSEPPTVTVAAQAPARPAPGPAVARALAPAAPVLSVSTPSAASPALAVAAPTSEPRRIGRNRDPDGDQTPDLSDYVNQGEQPAMADVINGLRQAGVQTGLAAFNPPGTRPPLVGLAVPEDFVLPDGYVRHFQATDDGQRIEAVLMFAPDRQFFDAAGRPIALPKDRLVPPEFAPAGMPIRRIVIPAATEAGRR